MVDVCLQVQHLEALKGRFPDPLLNRTFGASLRGDGFARDGAQALVAAAAANRHALALTVLTKITATPEEWLAQLGRMENQAGKGDIAAARKEHEAWWRGFWDRSWIFVEGGNTPLPSNTLPWRIGVDSNGQSNFRGEIGGTHVIGKALTPVEIARAAEAAPLTARKLDQEPIATACTVTAWIKPAAGENGRILDKCTAGTPDGITFDTHPGLSLRWIVGDHTMVQPDCLKADAWQHVAATFDGTTGQRRIYLNGQLVKEERAGNPADVVTRGYVLQRFMAACAGRGVSPIKFNGSIFTVEKQPGAPAETPTAIPTGGCGAGITGSKTRASRTGRCWPPVILK